MYPRQQGEVGCRAHVAEGGAGEKSQLLDLTWRIEVTGVADRLDVGERGEAWMTSWF